MSCIIRDSLFEFSHGSLQASKGLIKPGNMLTGRPSTDARSLNPDLPHTGRRDREQRALNESSTSRDGGLSAQRHKRIGYLGESRLMHLESCDRAQYLPHVHLTFLA